MYEDKLNAQAVTSARVIRGTPPMLESCSAFGVYHVVCKSAEGEVLWEEDIHNTVCTQGKNTFLDAGLAGSSYTVTGPYIGLISLVSFTAIAAGDTMAQIAGTNGWKEAGTTNAPTYSGSRPTASWAAASAGAKALSSTADFTFTGSGTVKGIFVVFGSGASATVLNTGGSLLSAGLFGSDKAVSASDVINVSYTFSL